MRAEHGDLRALDGSDGWARRTEDGVEWSEDGYSGVRPQVAIGGGVMLVSWANAVPESIRGMVDDGRHVERFPIAGSDDTSVWGAMEKLSTVEVWRFYLNSNTLHLLQSSIGLHLQDPLTVPSQAAIYIAHCTPIWRLFHPRSTRLW